MPGVLYVNEYRLGSAESPNSLRRLPGRVSGKQSVEIGQTGAKSDPFGPMVRIVKITPTCDCFIDIGLNPSVSNETDWCPAGIPQEFEVISGDCIAVLEA